MRKLNWLLPIVLALVVAAGIATYLQFFRDTWQPPRVVKFESDGSVFSLFPSYMSWAPDPEEGGMQALLLRNDDYYYYFGSDYEIPVRYLTNDGSALHLASNDWSVSLNGTVVSLSLSHEEALAWLAGASDEQLADLRTIAIKDDAGPGLPAALKRLAAANPHVDLCVESAMDLQTALTLFTPRAILCGDTDIGQLTGLKGQPEIDTLILGASESGSFDYLPSLPKLRRLVIGDWDIGKAGPLPAGLDRLKSLVVVVEGELSNISALQAAPAGLEELSFQVEHTISDLDGLEKMSNLRALILAIGDEDSPVSMPDLAPLRKLRWVGLPRGVNQEQLTAIIKSRPGIEILELPEMKKSLDLAPLPDLKNLRGLVLGGVYEHLDVVQSLKSLRFLGISNESWPDSPDKVAEIRAALPDAVVIRIGAGCLGSGWLLLLLPLLGCAWSWHESRVRSARVA